MSTARQGQSGLGLEAQEEAVRAFVGQGRGKIIASFKEVETGKGSNALARRPELRAALDAAKKAKATLLIAKLDRLARNVAFIAALMDSKVEFRCCDMPDANRLTMHIMAAFAEHERAQIAQRTKEALAAARARGVVLGATGKALAAANKAKARASLEPVRPVLLELSGRAMTRKEIAAELNGRGVASPGGGLWHPSSVHKALARLAAA